MGRWKEIGHSLGFNILFPRLFLFVLMPCGLLIAFPAPPAFPLLLAALQPDYAELVLICCLMLFGLSVAANLSISRYLRLTQTQGSPYSYEAQYDPFMRSSYFRIQVTDKKAFRHLLRDIRRDQPREPIRFWLLVDDLTVVPPLLLIGLFALVFMLVPWLLKRLCASLRGRKAQPGPQD